MGLQPFPEAVVEPHGGRVRRQDPPPVVARMSDRLGRTAGPFAALLVGALVLYATALPWRLAALPLSAAAVWCGVRVLHALSVLRRNGRGARGWFAAVAGLSAGVLLLVGTGVQALLYPVAQADERCRAGATTLQAQEECSEQTRRRLGVPTG